MSNENMTAASEIVARLVTAPLPVGAEADAVWMLVRLKGGEGAFGWCARSAGDIESEELLGALDGFCAWLRQQLASDWE